MRILTATILIAMSAPSYALDVDDFYDLEGYTVRAVTNIDGEFEGCEYDKKIKLRNGWILTCSSYRYSYSYSPRIAILTQDVGSGYAVKAVIGDYVYDMKPVIKK